MTRIRQGVWSKNVTNIGPQMTSTMTGEFGTKSDQQGAPNDLEYELMMNSFKISPLNIFSCDIGTSENRRKDLKLCKLSSIN